ncbi:hypothetical protein D3C76_1396150 [compost metagenome]
MAGEHFAFFLRDRTEARFRPAVELCQLCNIRFARGLQRCCLLRVSLDQPRQNILRIQGTIAGAVPGVRIGDSFPVFLQGMGFDSG